MPESRESDASFYLFSKGFQSLLANNASLVVTAFYADATTAEEDKYKATDGHVVRLTAECKMKRGTSGSQTPIWPPRFASTPENPNPLPISTLTLRGGFPANRAIILDFGGYYLKISYLTHTSVQFYTNAIWEKSIMAVNKKNRGFRVGLAIKFEDCCLVFPSNDLIYQPVWSSSLEDLMGSYIDLSSSYDKYLELVASWITMRATSSNARSAPVCSVIRDFPDIWFGVGVYTCCEILFMAGVSPFLTEIEVFDNPSRTARICEAMYTYKHISATQLPSLLNPCLKDEILAPSLDQRKRYSDWLHVYGKKMSAITPRMADLIDLYKDNLWRLSSQSDIWFRSVDTNVDTPILYDTFEPNYLRSAFEGKDVHLGELIFGSSQWKSYGLKAGAPNALVAMFSRGGLLDLSDKPTYLCLPKYTDLFVPYGPTKWRTRTTYTYRMQKQVWCITPCLPPNSVASPSTKSISRKEIEEITGKDRDTMLFKSIVSDTRGVAIGPLEYCGNGRVIKMPHNKTMVSIVRHDPAIPEFYAVRELTGLERKSNGLDRRGSSKKAMSKVQKRKRTQILGDTQSFSDPPTSSPLPDMVVPPVKKRRLSADKALVVSAVGKENIDLDKISLGRRK